jgi:putative hydrolase of the HAD superfamily
MSALLFGLDDTLIVEDAAASAAFMATAVWAATQRRELDAAALAAAARQQARELWNATPVHPYCLRVGISSSEGLWCRFEGDTTEVRWLREWSPEYRRTAWLRALAAQDAGDEELAAELGARFGAERRRRHEVFPDAEPALATLGEHAPLALVTNGASCLQREKLEASGLAPHFQAIVVSGDLGVGKPDPRAFRRALDLLGCDDAVIIGNSVERDVRGALEIGLGAVWVNHYGKPRDEDHPPVPEIRRLDDLIPPSGILKPWRPPSCRSRA